MRVSLKKGTFESAPLSEIHFFITSKIYNMKQLLVSTCALLLFLLTTKTFAQEKVKMKENKTKMKDKGMGMNNMEYPYTAMYSSNFKIGDPANAKMILDLWKDWDDNAFERHNYMADTLVMFFPDGSMLRGKDSCLAGAKKFRSSLSGVTSVLNAWIPLKSVDRNEDWVALWGIETDTWPDGKTEKKEIQEIWQINKNGKIVFMKQFSSKPAMQ